MFKKLVSIAAAAIMSLSIVSAAPISADNRAVSSTAYVNDLANYRKQSRLILRSARADYDIAEIAVAVDSAGDAVIFPDAAYDDGPSYAVVHRANVKRGQVYVLAERLDGYGEVDAINYYLVDGKYARTDKLVRDYQRANGEMPTYRVTR